MILAVEELGIGSLGLGLLDFAEIEVHQIPDVVGIEALLVIVDDVLVESLHLGPVLGDLVLGGGDAGEALHRRDVVDSVDLAEQPHALLDEEVEAPELGIVDAEAGGHHEAANHIADRHRDDRREVDGLAIAGVQVSDELMDFGLRIGFGNGHVSVGVLGTYLYY